MTEKEMGVFLRCVHIKSEFCGLQEIHGQHNVTGKDVLSPATRLQTVVEMQSSTTRDACFAAVAKKTSKDDLEFMSPKLQKFAHRVSVVSNVIDDTMSSPATNKLLAGVCIDFLHQKGSSMAPRQLQCCSPCRADSRAPRSSQAAKSVAITANKPSAPSASVVLPPTSLLDKVPGELCESKAEAMWSFGPQTLSARNDKATANCNPSLPVETTCKCSCKSCGWRVTIAKLETQ